MAKILNKIQNKISRKNTTLIYNHLKRTNITQMKIT